MGKKQEKGKKGEAVQYYSRKQALRHLQIGLPNFIRLCLWKGIYPTQPNNLKVVGKGDTKPKIYYKRKDVNLLIHEPVVNKLRELRAFNMKMKKARERNDKDKMYRLQKCRPRYTLHHMVKELYPTREDALRNIDDCLKSIFIFATLPKMTQFNGAYVSRCRMLKLHFLNYCIAMQCVRRAFISVKGYHVECDIAGVTGIRWLMPHQHCGTAPPSSCDYRLLANQVEFDCTMLASVLKNLYTDAGLLYPPRFKMDEDADWSESDMLASLTFPLATVENDIEERLEELNRFRDMDEDVAAAADNEARVAAIQSLFRGKKVFLNREVPREVFCFLLRNCGAQVSWDHSVATGGASFSEDDEGIHYHVIDRPLAANGGDGRVSRFYVQPQYVFDSLNAARLLPVKDYLPGARLIPHLSPFVDYTSGSGAGGVRYVPPEYRYLQGEIGADELHADVGSDDDVSDSDEGVVEADEREYESEDDDDEDDDNEEEVDGDMEVDLDGEEDVDDVIADDVIVVEKEKKKSNRKSKDNVTQKSKAPKRKSKEEYNKEIEARKEIRMQEMSLPKKRVNLYNKMKHAEKKEKSTLENLKQKRREVNKRRQSSKK